MCGHGIVAVTTIASSGSIMPGGDGAGSSTTRPLDRRAPRSGRPGPVGQVGQGEAGGS